MLEQLRRQSRSFIIWILFGIIIAVFIISFGPQAKRNQPGCGASAQYAMEVGGRQVSINSWRFAMNGLKGKGESEAETAYRRQQALDLLAERELLAKAAEERGFRVSDDVVNQAIAAGEFYILGFRIRMSSPEFWTDFKRLEEFSGSLGLTNVTQLADEQKQEHLAEMTRHLLMSTAPISDEEIQKFYIQENTKVTVDYVKFDVNTYKKALALTPSDLELYAKTHEKELKKEWDTEKAEWNTAKPRILARHIFVRIEQPAPAGDDDDSGAGKDGDKNGDAAKKAAADKKAAAVAAAKKDARDKAEAARARIAGGADFATVAGEVSDDELTRARGGLIGWRPAESLGYGKKVLDAAKSLKAGQLSQVIEGPDGFHLIQVVDKSDKALTFEQKKPDLAAKLAPDHYAHALARRDAEKALADARTTPLDQLFKRGPRSIDPSQMQNLPPEILEQLQKEEVPPPPDETGEGGEQGMIYRESDNILASVSATQTPATAAAPAPAPAKADKDTGKPQGGDATAAAAAPTGEVLPKVDVPQPTIQSVGPTSRASSPGPGSVDFLAGVGHSEKLLDDLFDKISVGVMGPQVYEVKGPPSDGYVIVQLKAREDADLSKLDKVKDELTREVENQKGIQRLAQWIQERCNDAAKNGEIRVNRRVVEAGEKNPSQFGYQPCASLNVLSIRSQMRTRE